MKSGKYFILVGLVLTLIGFGCKKQLIEKYNENPSSIKKTSEIKAASSFNWSTFNKVGVSFVAKSEDVRVSTFKVIAPDGTNLFQKYHKASEDLSFNLDVPNQYDSVLVSYGTNSKYFNTRSGLVEFRLN